MSWRHSLSKYLKPSHLKHIYEFGVYSGQSLKDIAYALKLANISDYQIFGFDSFEGMPDEKNEQISQDCWKSGEFDARSLFSVKTVDKCLEKIYNILEQDGLTVTLIPGFFEQVLTENIIKEYNMQPALYVDFDADLYSSTKTALKFLLDYKLIQVGTILGFDDWGGSKEWETNQSGESRALYEICRETGLECYLLEQIGYAFPHVQTIFRVVAMPTQWLNN